MLIGLDIYLQHNRRYDLGFMLLLVRKYATLFRFFQKIKGFFQSPIILLYKVFYGGNDFNIRLHATSHKITPVGISIFFGTNHKPNVIRNSKN